jgi:hypothetical protein
MINSRRCRVKHGQSLNRARILKNRCTPPYLSSLACEKGVRIMERCNDTGRILSCCRDALDEIKKDAPTGATWERRWASLMALLRTACEVLKREAPTWWKNQIYAPNAGIKGRDQKKTWSPDIFGSFIWTDSNLFLHEGKHTTGQSLNITLPGASVQALAGALGGGSAEQPRPMPPPAPPPKPELSYHTIRSSCCARSPEGQRRCANGAEHRHP